MYHAVSTVYEYVTLYVHTSLLLLSPGSILSIPEQTYHILYIYLVLHVIYNDRGKNELGMDRGIAKTFSELVGLPCGDIAMWGVVGVKDEGVWGGGEVMFVVRAVGGGVRFNERVGLTGVRLQSSLSSLKKVC